MSVSSDTWQLGGQSVQVTHLEKRYWPTAEFTKGDMHPADLTPEVVLKRVGRLGDCFAQVLHAGQRIPE